jgi:pimeloyl-ACP methyl ester carboxylesterase
MAIALSGMAQAQQEPVADVATAWAAAPTNAIASEEKQFRNGAVVLSGTLYVPQRREKVPAVIALHSASCPTRDLPLYRHLTQMLPPLGIAVLVFDRRGSGRSGGEPARGDYQALADDGIAAQRLLAQDPRIDAGHIGFWGLSQGGWIVLLAAARSPATAFVVSISAPMTTPDVQMNFAVANILRIKGYSQADIDSAVAARTAVDDAARGRLDRASAQQRLSAATTKPWFEFTYLDGTMTDEYMSNWGREISHDPLPTLASVKAPTLIVYGTRDVWVPVRASVEALKASAAQHPNISVTVVAGADHEMNLSTPAAVQIDPSKLSDEAPDAPEYFALLASWLTAQGLTRRQ